jgi:ABC-type antimicrobial peptide transport system permease subunit
MFFLSYISAELRRRRGRTLLTALGLAVGVGLVATVTALSQGLDDAQDEVLKPLTGVGTDMSVSRPISRGTDEGQKENGGGRVRLGDAGKPGEKFTRDDLVSAQVSFPETQLERVRSVTGVQGAAASLTLNRLQVSGTVPDQPPGQGRGGFGGGGGPPGGPDSIDFKQSTIAGVDASLPSLGPVTSGQVETGSYFSAGGSYEAILSAGYARTNKLHVGDTITVKDRKFKVVGLAKAPLGGQSSDVYVRLGELQKLADRAGRVNGMQVRATSSDAVDSVATQVKAAVPGSKVTTASDLAGRVSGSLVDAKNLSNKLGTALAVVALIAAFLIAGLLTLSSVNKRVRELGTLKAIGWPQRLVIRQVTGESLAQGLLGGLLGAALGIAGAAMVGAVAPELKATVASQAAGGGPAGPGGPMGPGGGPGRAVAVFGQGQIQAGSSTVKLDAPVEPKLILLAIGLALVGGLVSGAIGGARVARLRPADALRSVE